MTLYIDIFPIIISIHAPTRGATMDGLIQAHSTKISIHAPTRGATHSPVWSRISCPFQSTLLQEERQAMAALGYVDDFISIHAPTRGATQGSQERMR